MAPAAPHHRGGGSCAGDHQNAGRPQHHHEQTCDHAGPAGSCGSVASQEMQGTGLAEGIGQLHGLLQVLSIPVRPGLWWCSEAGGSCGTAQFGVKHCRIGIPRFLEMVFFCAGQQAVCSAPCAGGPLEPGPRSPE